MPQPSSRPTTTKAIDPRMGMVTSLQSWEIPDMAVAYAENFRFFLGPDGLISAKTRPGLIEDTLSAWGRPINDVGWTPQGSTVIAASNAIATVDASGNIHSLGVVSCGSNCRAFLLPFGDDLIVFDGDYPKFYTGSTGEFGLLTDRAGRLRQNEWNSSIDAYVSTTSHWDIVSALTKAGERVTTPSWGSDHTIRATAATARIFRTKAEPPGQVHFEFYNQSGVLLSGGRSDPVPASGIAGQSQDVALIESFTFSNGPVLSAGETYKCMVAYSNASAVKPDWTAGSSNVWTSPSGVAGGTSGYWLIGESGAFSGVQSGAWLSFGAHLTEVQRVSGNTVELTSAHLYSGAWTWKNPDRHISLCHGSNRVSWGIANTYVSAAFGAVSNVDAIIGIKPGLPPKARWGVSRQNRLYIFGVQDSNKSKFYYSDAYDKDTWGLFEGIGTRAGTQPVNKGDGAGIIGGAEIYGDLFLFKGGVSADGNELPASIHRVTGTPDQNLSVQLLQKDVTSASGYGIKSVTDDIYFLNYTDGLLSLRGVEAYGDVRANPLGEAILDKFQALDSSNNRKMNEISFMDFNPITNDITIKLTGYDPLIVFNRKTNGFSLWTFAQGAIVPSCVRTRGQGYYVGDTNGHLYHMDRSESYLDDAGVMPAYKIYGKVHSIDEDPQTDKQADRLVLNLKTGPTLVGCVGQVNIWKDRNALSRSDTNQAQVIEWTIGGWADSPLWAIARAPLAGLARLPLSSDDLPIRTWDINHLFKFIEIGMDDIVPVGGHLTLRDIKLDSFHVGRP